MPIKVNIPDVGKVNFPNDMSMKDIDSAVHQIYSDKIAKNPPQVPKPTFRAENYETENLNAERVRKGLPGYDTSPAKASTGSFKGDAKESLKWGVESALDVGGAVSFTGGLATISEATSIASRAANAAQKAQQATKEVQTLRKTIQGLQATKKTAEAAKVAPQYQKAMKAAKEAWEVSRTLTDKADKAKKGTLALGKIVEHLKQPGVIAKFKGGRALEYFLLTKLGLSKTDTTKVLSMLKE